MLSQRPWETAVGTPSRRLKGYPRTKSAPSRKGSYSVLKKKGVDGLRRFLMCCSSALMAFPDGSLATYESLILKSVNTYKREKRKEKHVISLEDILRLTSLVTKEHNLVHVHSIKKEYLHLVNPDKLTKLRKSTDISFSYQQGRWSSNQNFQLLYQ